MSEKNTSKNQKWKDMANKANDESLLNPENELNFDNEDVLSIGEEPRGQLENELNDMEVKYNELNNQLLYAKAEFENFRKRSEREVADALKFGPQKLLKELLPTIDSLEKSLEILEQHKTDVGAVKEGITLTYQSLLSTLEKFAVKQINPQKENFDPAWHQAMAMQESPEHASGQVIMVLQKGYTLNDRLLRPALVIVAK